PAMTARVFPLGHCTAPPTVVTTAATTARDHPLGHAARQETREAAMTARACPLGHSATSQTAISENKMEFDTAIWPATKRVDFVFDPEPERLPTQDELNLQAAQLRYHVAHSQLPVDMTQILHPAQIADLQENDDEIGYIYKMVYRYGSDIPWGQVQYIN